MRSCSRRLGLFAAWPKRPFWTRRSLRQPWRLSSTRSVALSSAQSIVQAHAAHGWIVSAVLIWCLVSVQLCCPGLCKTLLPEFLVHAPVVVCAGLCKMLLPCFLIHAPVVVCDQGYGGCLPKDMLQFTQSYIEDAHNLSHSS